MGKKIVNTPAIPPVVATHVTEAPAVTVHTPTTRRPTGPRRSAKTHRPAGPPRPVNGYFRFVTGLRAAMPDSETMSVVEFSKIAGAKWRALTPLQRDAYTTAAQADMAVWKSTRPPPLPFPSDNDRVLTAMQIFMKKNWYRVHNRIRSEAPPGTAQDAMFGMTSKAMSTEWQTMSDSTRAEYINEHLAHRMRFIEESAKAKVLAQAARAGVAEKHAKPKRARVEGAAEVTPVVAPVVVAAVMEAVKAEKKVRKERRRKEPTDESSSSEEPVKKRRSKKVVQ